MNWVMIGRILTSTAVVTSALTLATASMAGALVEPSDPDSGTETTVVDNGTGDTRVVPLSPVLPEIAVGPQWIAINWTALGGDARDVEVTAETSHPEVQISYPTSPNDGTYSSGYWNDELIESEIDYTAIKVTYVPDPENNGPVPPPTFLTVTVSYVSDTGPQTETFDMPFDNDDENSDDENSDDENSDDGGFGNNGNGNNNGNGQGNGNGNSSGSNNGNGNSGNNNGDSDDSDSDDSDSDSDSDDSDSDDGAFGNNGNGNNNGRGNGNGRGNSSVK